MSLTYIFIDFLMLSIFVIGFANHRHYNRQHLQVYWNSSNILFRSSGFLTVYLGDLVDFLCPYYEDPYSNTNVEYNTLYLVNKNDYYECNTTNYNPLLKCNKPFDTQRLIYTLSISKYLPYPNLPEFHAGHFYYFISTSSGHYSNMDQRHRGLCYTKNMKLTMHVQKHYRHHHLEEQRRWSTPIIAKRTNFTFIDLNERFSSFSSLSSKTSRTFHSIFLLSSFCLLAKSRT